MEGEGEHCNKGPQMDMGNVADSGVCYNLPFDITQKMQLSINIEEFDYYGLGDVMALATYDPQLLNDELDILQNVSSNTSRGFYPTQQTGKQLTSVNQ